MPRSYWAQRIPCIFRLRGDLDPYWGSDRTLDPARVPGARPGAVPQCGHRPGAPGHRQDVHGQDGATVGSLRISIQVLVLEHGHDPQGVRCKSCEENEMFPSCKAGDGLCKPIFGFAFPPPSNVTHPSHFPKPGGGGAGWSPPARGGPPHPTHPPPTPSLAPRGIVGVSCRPPPRPHGVQC